jgi:hypothetical protein
MLRLLCHIEFTTENINYAFKSRYLDIVPLRQLLQRNVCFNSFNLEYISIHCLIRIKLKI